MNTTQAPAAVDAPRAPGWIGTKPSRTQLAAVLLIGTMGMMICGVQPVLLGSLVLEHRLSAAALGWATTAEFSSLAVGIWLAGTFWTPERMRRRMVLAALLAGLADCLVVGEADTAVLINRTLAGLPEGVLVWLTSCMVARSPTPARMSGVFLTLQNISQFVFAAILPATLMYRYGADGGFVALALTAALALLAAPFIPDHFVQLPSAVNHSGKPVYTANGIACLLSVFLIAAFSIGIFAYLEPLGAQSHMNEEMVGYAVSAVLGASTLGSLLAAIVPKIPHYTVFLVCVVVNAAVVAVFAARPGPLAFFTASAVFGFFWLFFLPYQLPMAIEADPTRQITVILPGAQLVGAGMGPLLSSFFVTNSDARGALVACSGCFLVAFLITTTQHAMRRARSQPTARGTAL